jgi:hypothetical protein
MHTRRQIRRENLDAVIEQLKLGPLVLVVHSASSRSGQRALILLDLLPTWASDEEILVDNQARLYDFPPAASAATREAQAASAIVPCFSCRQHYKLSLHKAARRPLGG